MGKSSYVLCKALWDLPTYVRHCEVSKRGLAEELKALEDEMDVELRKLNEFEQDAFFREVNDHWIETAETLPRLQWYSQLLVTYGFFEKVLNDLCIEQQHASGSKLSFKDLHGQGISRAQNYLSRVIGASDAFTSSEWQSIKLIGVLRNSIAHRDGFIDYEPDKPQSSFSQISKIVGVELRQETIAQEDVQIFFSDGVVVEALNLFDSFFRALSKEFENG